MSAKHRSTIYERLEPILGDEETEAMLLHFPSSDAAEPVTREFLRAELAELRTELAGQSAQLRTELAAQSAELRTELAGQSAELRTELAGQSAELRTEFGDAIHRQTVWLLGINVTTLTMAVALARLVS